GAAFGREKIPGPVLPFERSGQRLAPPVRPERKAAVGIDVPLGVDLGILLLLTVQRTAFQELDVAFVEDHFPLDRVGLRIAARAEQGCEEQGQADPATATAANRSTSRHHRCPRESMLERAQRAKEESAADPADSSFQPAPSARMIINPATA